MSHQEDPGDDSALPEDVISRLAEALAGEAESTPAELAEARAQVDPEKFAAMAELSRALEFRGVRRQAQSVPDPEWAKDLELDTGEAQAPGEATGGTRGTGGEAPPAGGILAPSGTTRPGPALWLVPALTAAAALLIWSILPSADPGQGSPRGAGFQGDPGADLGTGGENAGDRAAQLSIARRTLLLSLDGGPGDEVRATIRSANGESTWTPIKLGRVSAATKIQEEDWARLDRDAAYVVEVLTSSLASGEEQRVLLPLSWQP